MDTAPRILVIGADFVQLVGCGASVTVNARKHSLTRSTHCLTTLWLNDPSSLFVTSLRFVDPLWLFPSRCTPLSVSLYLKSFASLLVTLPATAFCRAVLMGPYLLLFLLAVPFPPSLLLFLPTSLFPLIICYATLALQGSSHWSPFLSLPVLICYATVIPSYTSHWSLSAELSITLSLAFLSLYPPSHVVWSHTFAVRDLFLPTACYWGVFHLRRLYISREHKGCAASGGCVWGQQLQFRTYFCSGGII